MNSVLGLLVFAAIVYAIYLFVESQDRTKRNAFEEVAEQLGMHYFSAGNSQYRSAIEEAVPAPRRFTSHLRHILVGERDGQEVAVARLVFEPEFEKGNVREHTVFCARLDGLDLPSFEVVPINLAQSIFRSSSIPLPKEIAKSYDIAMEDPIPDELIECLRDYLGSRKKNRIVWRDGYFTYLVMGHVAETSALDTFIEGGLEAMSQILVASCNASHRRLNKPDCAMSSSLADTGETTEDDSSAELKVDDGTLEQKILGDHPGFKPLAKNLIPGFGWCYGLGVALGAWTTKHEVELIDTSRSLELAEVDEFLNKCIQEAEEIGLFPCFGHLSRRHDLRQLGWLSFDNSILVLAAQGSILGIPHRIVEAYSCYSDDRVFHTANQPVNLVCLPGERSLTMLDASLAEIVQAHITEAALSFGHSAIELDAKFAAKTFEEMRRTQVQELVSKGCAKWRDPVMKDEYHLTLRGMLRIAFRTRRSDSENKLFVRNTEF